MPQMFHHMLFCLFAVAQMFIKVALFLEAYSVLKTGCTPGQPPWLADKVNVSQLAQRRCDNVVALSKMRVVPTSVSDVVTMSLSDVIKTLPQRCYNVTATLTIGFLDHFATEHSDFFPFIKT